MSRINIGNITDSEPKKKKSAIAGDLAGSVSNTIGTGKHAQDSVVWLTIRWSFFLGLALSAILIIFMWPSTPEGAHPPMKNAFPIEELKTIWGIFIPIVTLALGYMFGKGK